MKSKTSALVMGVGPEEGLGGSLSKRFAKEGMTVFVCGRTLKKVENLCTIINDTSGNAIPIVADVTDADDVTNMMKVISNSNIPLELAVYNAGNNRPESFLDVTPEVFISMWQVICFGAFLTSQALLRLMIEQQEMTSKQSLFFTGASGSIRGKAGFSSFASGKGGLRMLAQSIAREFGPKGIHVAHIIIDGVIKGDKVVKGFPEYANSLGEDGLLDLNAIADNYWHLHQQHKTAWTQEIDLRPFKEIF